MDNHMETKVIFIHRDGQTSCISRDNVMVSIGHHDITNMVHSMNTRASRKDMIILERIIKELTKQVDG